MHVNTSCLKILALSMTLGASIQATAQDFYVGAGFGQSNYDGDLGSIGRGDLKADDSGTAWKLFGGYQFHPNVAVEGSWLKLGDGEIPDTQGGKIEADGFTLAAVGALPVGRDFKLLGKLGMYFWDWEASDRTGSADDDGNDIFFGLGAQYDINEKFAVRGEYERFELDSVDVNLLSISAMLKF